MPGGQKTILYLFKQTHVIGFHDYFFQSHRGEDGRTDELVLLSWTGLSDCLDKTESTPFNRVH